MCYPVQCSKCGKTTWGGCGAHVSSVMSRVPADQQCRCNQQQSSTAPKIPTPAVKR